MQAWPRLLSLSSFVLLFGFTMAAAAAQLPPPGYNSHWRAADGTEKLALEFGGGWDISLGPSRTTQTRGWNYTMGSGYNLNRHLAIVGEYSFNRFTVPKILPTNADPNPPSGSVHIWSLTANPKYQYFATERFGAYLIGGGGFFRKQVEGFAGANAGGVDFGTGFALKVSDNSNAKFYAEMRYVWIDTQPAASGTPYSTSTLNGRTSFAPITLGIRW